MDRKQKIIKIGVFGLLIVVLLTTSGYLMYQMTKKQPVSQQFQKNEVTESISQKETTPEATNADNQKKYIITDLKNGWMQYENFELGYTIEFPSGWITKFPKEIYRGSIEIENIDSTNFPIKNSGDNLYREFSNNYLVLSVSPYAYRLKTTENGDVLDQTIDENIKYYNNPLMNYESTLVYKNELVIGKNTFKMVKDKLRNEDYYLYYIHNSSYSLLFYIKTTQEDYNAIPEYKHMLESFTIK